MMQSASTEELFKMPNEARGQAGQTGAGNANDSAVPTNSSGQYQPGSLDNATTPEAPPPAYTPTRETGTIYTGKEDTEALNAIQLLIDNGINPMNLSDSQLASFKQQNSATQRSSIEVYINNRHQASTRTVNDNELPEASSKKRSNKRSKKPPTYPLNVKDLVNENVSTKGSTPRQEEIDDNEENLPVNHNLTRSGAGTYIQLHQPSQTDSVELPKSALPQL